MTFCRLSLFLLIFCFLAGCQEREVELKLPYAEDRLVISSNLKAGEPIKVEVSRTFKPSGIVPANTRVSGAIVTLTKNDQTTIILNSDGAGFYLSDILVESGAEYVVRASMEGFPDVESLPVKVPVSKPDFSYELRKDVKGLNNPNTPQDLVNLYFSESEVLSGFYLIAFTANYEKEVRSRYWTSNDNFASTEESCFAKFSDNSGGYLNNLTLLRGDCMPKQGNPISFSLEVAVGRIDTLNSKIGKFYFEYAHTANMRVANVSQEWFKWAQSENQQPKSVDHFVQVPQETYTNVKNGYGVVYASNETSIEIDL